MANISAYADLRVKQQRIYLSMVISYYREPDVLIHMKSMYATFHTYIAISFPKIDKFCSESGHLQIFLFP